MKLNLQTDFALRILMTLGGEPDRLHTVEEIADRFNLSKNHLMKTAQALSANGFVETVRGRSGGLRLAIPVSDISVGAVVRAIEPDMRMAECFQKGVSGQNCALLPSCKLKPILGEALTSFLSVLDERKLSELV